MENSQLALTKDSESLTCEQPSQEDGTCQDHSERPLSPFIPQLYPQTHTRSTLTCVQSAELLGSALRLDQLDLSRTEIHRDVVKIGPWCTVCLAPCHPNTLGPTYAEEVNIIKLSY